MGFHTKPWTERINALGDKAEGAFELYAEAHGLAVVRFGFNRPPFTRFSKLPALLRFTPDYIVEGAHHHFIECKGTASSTLKLKVNAMQALGEWQQILPVTLFLYNSRKKAYSTVYYERALERCLQVPIQQFENDKNEFYEIDVSDLTWEKTYER